MSKAKAILEDKRSEFRRAHPVATGTCLTVREVFDAYLSQHECAEPTKAKYRKQLVSLLALVGDKQAGSANWTQTPGASGLLLA